MFEARTGKALSSGSSEAVNLYQEAVDLISQVSEFKFSNKYRLTC